MKTVAITGASGFVGKALVKFLKGTGEYRLKLFTRDRLKLEDVSDENVQVFGGDLLKINSLNGFIEPGCTLINMAFLNTKDNIANLLAAHNLIEASIRMRAKRIIHCSTANVVGRNKNPVIDEESKNFPTTEYEKIKLAIEELFLRNLKQNIDIRIIRPTAVFGIGGKNLNSTIDFVMESSYLKKALRMSLFHNRKMNLVSVENVAAAIRFVIDLEKVSYERRFIISDDDSAANTFGQVCKIIHNVAKKQVPHMVSVPFERYIQKLFLRILHGPSVVPNRYYSRNRLSQNGFCPPFAFEERIRYYTEKYLQERGYAPLETQ